MRHLFRTLLSRFLKENEWTQQNLADRLETDQATVSRWLSGRVEVSAEAIQRLVQIVPAEHRSVLMEAYLRDRIPEGLEHLVDLRPTTVSSEHPPIKQLKGPEFPEVADVNLKRRLVFLCHLALQSPEIRKVVDLLYRLICGRRPRNLSRILSKSME